MSGDQQRRYLANLRRRYSQELAQCRGQVHELLTDSRLDLLGREMADYIAGYRAAHEAGPTRSEVCDALHLPGRLMLMPPQLPAVLHRTWRATVLDPLFAGARRRGWITYTRQARSLNQPAPADDPTPRPPEATEPPGPPDTTGQ